MMNFKLRLAKIEALPAIIREMVEPARHIQSFRVNQDLWHVGQCPHKYHRRGRAARTASLIR